MVAVVFRLAMCELRAYLDPFEMTNGKSFGIVKKS